MSEIKSAAAIGCFALFWSTLTLLFDGAILYGVAQQLQVYVYASTTGLITKSAVSARPHSKGGSTYDVDIGYTYAVSGKSYDGTRYRYEHMSSSDNWAAVVVKNFPPGKSVTVFYNPRNPSDAVLIQGIEGFDLFAFAFLAPFNAVMLSFWYAGLKALRERRRGKAFSDVKILSEGSLTRARIVAFPAFAVAGMTLAAEAFVSVFVVGFFLGGFHPSITVAVVQWSVLLLSAAAVFVRQKVREQSGANDLIIDRVRREVTLPKYVARHEHVTLPLAAVSRISSRSTKDRRSSAVRHAVTIEWVASGAARAEIVAEWQDQRKAEAFAEWLRQEIQATKRE
ncbi:MAG TPA: DUF3592 domain-containing protein [Planctomycetota bacterium]|nr:DUF3592 domain-containing protein [Planctomycetota bacterium]